MRLNSLACLHNLDLPDTSTGMHTSHARSPHYTFLVERSLQNYDK